MGARHTELSTPTSENTAEREGVGEGEREGEEGESEFPGGFDIELAGGDEGMERENDREEEAVKRKPETKLRKVTSGGNLTGENGIYRFLYLPSYFKESVFQCGHLL